MLRNMPFNSKNHKKRTLFNRMKVIHRVKFDNNIFLISLNISQFN